MHPPTWPLARCLLLALLLALLPVGGPAWPGAAQESTPEAPDAAERGDDDGAGFRRVLLEAERFVGAGWRPIRVGEGNYMVDAIGASHVSGGRLLHADAATTDATARAEMVVPGAGRYKVWARYEYPYPTYAVAFEVAIAQGGAERFRATYGLPDATRSWFFRGPDAPWRDFEHGVEGLVAEAHVAHLLDGPAVVTVRAVGAEAPLADRNVDLLFLTDDLEDTFRARGERLYPLLDELGRAVEGRTWVRLTNPSDAGEAVGFTAQYTINRAPWRLRTVRIGRDGVARGDRRPPPLAPGERTPWLDLSCRDTTHPCHLNLRVQGGRGIRATVEVASAPDDGAVLRRVEYVEPNGDRLLLSIPPYPAEEPGRIETAEEVLERLIAHVEQSPPPAGGRPPSRFLVYASMGDGWETTLDAPTRVRELSRRLFGLLGPSAPTVARASQARAAHELMRALGRETPPSYLHGGYRWFPSDEALAEAVADVEEAGARPYLRGFTYGDEVRLEEWLPKEGRDARFRAWLRARGADPRAYLPPDAVPDGDADEALWARVRLADGPAAARAQPRLSVDSRRFLDGWAVERLAEGAARLRARFGEGVVYGANYSPHPFFWPTTALWAGAFRAGAATRASHSDYWWQASELGPESTGYLLDVFRAGLRGRAGAIGPYVMPHSPGNTDRGVALGVAHALIHGATSLDLFTLGPEHAGTENYVSARDPGRLVAVRDALHRLGAVEDALLDGTRRPARVGLVLSESTERWEQATLGRFPLLTPEARFPSVVYAQERKFLWQALRHAQVPVDTVLEADLSTDAIDAYAVLYLPASHLDPVAAEGLARWVANGGTLVSVAGGGLRDPYDAPLDALLPVYGLRGAALERGETFFRPRVELPRLVPRDRVSVELPAATLELPALAVTQRLEPLDGARVLGRFSDGAPAVVEHAYGRGRAVSIGTLPGAAYVQSGFPDPPPPPDRGPGQHAPLTGFRADLRGLIALWADHVPRDWPVSSDPLVEVGQWDTPDGGLLVLANGGAAPIRATVRLHNVGPVRSAALLGGGPLSVEQRGDDAILTLDVGLVEYVRFSR